MNTMQCASGVGFVGLTRACDIFSQAPTPALTLYVPPSHFETQNTFLSQIFLAVF